MLFEVIDYFLNPRIVLTHIIGGGLFASLVNQGVGVKRLLGQVLLAEVVTWLLWLTIRDGWWTIIAVAFWLHLYERIVGPRARIQSGAVFIADEETFETLRKSNGAVKFESWKDGASGQRYLTTSLRYAEHWRTFWGRPGGKHAVEINDIGVIEDGPDYDIFKVIRDAGGEPGQCFHAHINNRLTITYIADSQESRDQWTVALRRLLGNKFERYREAWIEKLLRESKAEDLKKGITLELSCQILEHAGRSIYKPYTKDLASTFAKVPTSKGFAEIILTAEQFSKFFDFSIRRPEIQQVYDRLLYKAKGEHSLSAKRLRDFLLEEQKENIPLQACKQWILQWETVLPPQSFSVIGFTSWMLSQEQSIFNREHRRVYQDMTKPLSHYFIATSHNTYLTKDQLKGKSSVDAYVSAFKRGCKCVELDCWDGPNNEPIIYHGHTLTSKILFKDVIQAINEYAFYVSNYPVILSFENHCSLEQQRVMANHLTTILGSKLYTKAIPENEKILPSPEALKGYVLVKAKKLKDGDDVIYDYEYESDETDSEEEVDGINGDEKETDNRRLSSLRRSIRGGSANGERRGSTASTASTGTMDRRSSVIDDASSVSSSVNGDMDHDANKENEDDEIIEENKFNKKDSMRRFGSIKFRGSSDGGSKKDKKKKPVKIAKELSDLVVYCQAVHFKGFEDARENQHHFEMSSLGEKKSMKLAREDPKSFLQYNHRQLSRVYPAGHRVDSSNYDPVPLWNVGCQLIALNYQSPGRPMQLNQGLFQDNGFCGYVLKPSFMNQEEIQFDPRGPFDEGKVKFLMIRVISGLQLPYKTEEKTKSERNLHVQIKIAGVDADNKKEKTKSMKNNGYNPVWNEVLGFKVCVPELALVSFTVKEGDNFLGQNTLPFTSIQQGYRKVPLLSKSSEPLPYASIFVHVEIKESHL